MNNELDTSRRKLTIDVGLESTEDSLGGARVDPLLFSLLRKAVRRLGVERPSVVEGGSTVGRAAFGGVWNWSTSSSSERGSVPSRMVS